jgi:orotidine-5'-phosphate decarboxylase
MKIKYHPAVLYGFHGKTHFIIMQNQMQNVLALALDNVDSLRAIAGLIEQTKPFIGVYKIGLEQFTRFGPPVVDEVRKSGARIFLDLKFHDIPNTVAKAVTSACALGVQYLTIHTQGGSEMMRAAANAAANFREKGGQPPKIIGVTILTSISQEMLNNELNIGTPVIDQVRHLAGLAAASGLDGIVCSAADLPAIKPSLPSAFEIITPGIRLPENSADDQKRIASPRDALKSGATLLVIGRPITAAADPAKAAESFFRAIT